MKKFSNSRKGAESVLRDLVKIAYARGAQDALPNKQFEQEQRAGENDEPQFPAADNYPELVAILKQMGLSAEQIEACCAAVGSDQDTACDSDDPDTRLREFLAGRLDDDEIEKAVALAAKDRAALASDDPPPFSGRPRPGGTMDPIRNAATGARDAALANVRRLGIDSSVATQTFGLPPGSTGRVIGASDSSNRALAGFSARWPEVSRIRRV